MRGPDDDERRRVRAALGFPETPSGDAFDVIAARQARAQRSPRAPAPEVEPADVDDLAALHRRLAVLESKLEDLPQVVADVATQLVRAVDRRIAEHTDEIVRRLDGLEARVRVLESRAALRSAPGAPDSAPLARRQPGSLTGRFNLYDDPHEQDSDAS